MLALVPLCDDPRWKVGAFHGLGQSILRTLAYVRIKVPVCAGLENRSNICFLDTILLKLQLSLQCRRDSDRSRGRCRPRGCSCGLCRNKLRVCGLSRWWHCLFRVSNVGRSHGIRGSVVLLEACLDLGIRLIAHGLSRRHCCFL